MLGRFSPYSHYPPSSAPGTPPPFCLLVTLSQSEPYALTNDIGEHNSHRLLTVAALSVIIPLG